jgi:8-oxo-dGTP pyrophosphatase MutT (NUDIX family)
MSSINWKDKCWVTTIFLVREDGRVLLTMNKNLKTWIPVGGHIDPGETPIDAIRREVAEETGFSFEFVPALQSTEGRVEIFHPMQTQIEKVPHHGSHMNFVFAGRCTKWTAKSATDEEERLRWFSADELRNEELLESVRESALQAIELVRNS